MAFRIPSYACIAFALLVIAGPTMAEHASPAQITRAFAEKEHFNGVVLVGKGSAIEYVESFGMADAAAGTPLSADTRFDTGSISKWIAAIVVLRLVQQGELSLDEPIATYLPGYRRDTGARLTLRTLMSHASGVPNQVDEAIKRDPAVRDLSLDNANAVRRFASGDLQFEPGSDWDYSHSNWIIVKDVVETVSHRTYPQLVHDFLLAPLALRDSGTWVGHASSVPGMAAGYAQLSPPRLVDKASPDFMLMAGGYYTSANDMFRLLNGLFAGEILAPPQLAALLKVIRPAQHYALGGRTRDMAIGGIQRTVAWEYGSNGAFRVLAWRVIDDGHTVVIMNNTSFDHMKVGDLATQLLESTYH